MKGRLPFEQADIESSIVDRWQRVVRAFPEETAITTVGGRRYTYQEVDDASCRAANALLNELGTVNCPVVLLLDHTPSVLIGLWARSNLTRHTLRWTRHSSRVNYNY